MNDAGTQEASLFFPQYKRDREVLKLLLTVPAQNIDQLVKIMGMEIRNLTQRVLLNRKSIAGSDRHHGFADKRREIGELEQLNGLDAKCIKKAQQAFAVRKVLADHIEQKGLGLIGALLRLLLLIQNI